MNHQYNLARCLAFYPEQPAFEITLYCNWVLFRYTTIHRILAGHGQQTDSPISMAVTIANNILRRSMEFITPTHSQSMDDDDDDDDDYAENNFENVEDYDVLDHPGEEDEDFDRDYDSDYERDSYI